MRDDGICKKITAGDGLFAAAEKTGTVGERAGVLPSWPGPCSGCGKDCVDNGIGKTDTCGKRSGVFDRIVT